MEWLSILILLGLSVFLLYLYLVWNFNYWKKQGVNGPKPKPLIGTFPKTMIKNWNMIYDHTDIYQKYKSTDKFVGVYTIREPELLILAPELVRDIFVRHFKNFHNNAVAFWIDHKINRIIGRSPFLLTGNTWKDVRSQIVQALTSSKLKASYPITQNVCKKLVDYIKAMTLSPSKDCSINARKLSLRFTAEIVTDITYGMEENTLSINESTNKIMEADNQLINEFSYGFQLLSYANIIPYFSKLFKVRLMSESTENFFLKLLSDAIEIRKNQQMERNDFLNYLIQLQEKRNLTNYDLCAHAMTLTLDGYDTTASVICHCLLLLGRNKLAQDRLRNEIQNQLGENNHLSYDELNQMMYLDQCINETLRIFPPIAFSLKCCSEKIDLENYNGNKLTILPGQTVHLPFYALHHDPEFYPCPEEFIPERFSEENGGSKKFRDEGKFFPFGDGPRICPGMKFGLVQSKAAVAEIIKNFEVTAGEKTRKDNKIGSISLAALLKGKIWLNFRNLG